MEYVVVTGSTAVIKQFPYPSLQQSWAEEEFMNQGPLVVHLHKVIPFWQYKHPGNCMWKGCCWGSRCFIGRPISGSSLSVRASTQVMGTVLDALIGLLICQPCITCYLPVLNKFDGLKHYDNEQHMARVGQNKVRNQVMAWRRVGYRHNFKN